MYREEVQQRKEGNVLQGKFGNHLLILLLIFREQPENIAFTTQQQSHGNMSFMKI
jgi:hypothetical protein